MQNLVTIEKLWKFHGLREWRTVFRGYAPADFIRREVRRASRMADGHGAVRILVNDRAIGWFTRIPDVGPEYESINPEPYWP